MGRVEVSGMERLERVVRKRRVFEVVADGGSRLSSSSRRVVMGVAGGKARERVGGRPVPAKLVMSTFILLAAILILNAGCARSGVIRVVDTVRSRVGKPPINDELPLRVGMAHDKMTKPSGLLDKLQMHQPHRWGL